MTRFWTNNEVSRLIKLHNNGFNRYDISIILGRSLKSITNHMLENDLVPNAYQGTESGIFSLLASDPAYIAEDIENILNVKDVRCVTDKYNKRYRNLTIAFSLFHYQNDRERLNMDDMELNRLIRKYNLDNSNYVKYNASSYRIWKHTQERLKELNHE